MGKGIEAADFKECVSKGKIKKFGAAVKLVAKELDSAEDDLAVAQESFQKEHFKWATIQGYYAMFHAARALIYSKGYRERSHYCLIVALRTFFVAEGLLDVRFIEALQMAKTLRENADYEDEFSKEGAGDLLDKAEEFLKQTKEIIHNSKHA